MSSHDADENNESSNDLACSLVPISITLDSGYSTVASPCFTSSSCMTPPSVAIHQLGSPIFEHDLQSPIYDVKRKHLSRTDYEIYISTRKYLDILGQLVYRNAYHLIDEILANLSNDDLSRCSLVCQRWYSISKDYYRRRRLQKTKRNLFTKQKKTSARKVKLTSTPLQPITNLLDIQSSIPFIVETTAHENIRPSTPSLSPPSVQPENSLHLAASTMTFRYGYLRHLHGPTVPKRCPICAYVSIVDVNDQHGICTNPFCRNSFCQCCSGPYHPSSPCRTSTGPIQSPWRQRPALSPIFSHKTRSNLRRLLM